VALEQSADASIRTAHLVEERLTIQLKEEPTEYQVLYIYVINGLQAKVCCSFSQSSAEISLPHMIYFCCILHLYAM